MPEIPAGPYSIGSDRWPGLAKVAEECGEVIQVIGKIVAAGGEASHWDGSDLRTRLEDELADLQAAIRFCAQANNLSMWAMHTRTQDKLALFENWHHEHKDGSLNRDG